MASGLSYLQPSSFEMNSFSHLSLDPWNAGSSFDRGTAPSVDEYTSQTQSVDAGLWAEQTPLGGFLAPSRSSSFPIPMAFEPLPPLLQEDDSAPQPTPGSLMSQLREIGRPVAASPFQAHSATALSSAQLQIQSMEQQLAMLSSTTPLPMVRQAQSQAFASGPSSATATRGYAATSAARSSAAAAAPVAAVDEDAAESKGGTSAGAKRKRPVITGTSCAKCYVHKVKCSGGRPCERCIKFNRAASCCDRTLEDIRHLSQRKKQRREGPGAAAPAAATSAPASGAVISPISAASGASSLRVSPAAAAALAAGPIAPTMMPQLPYVAASIEHALISTQTPVAHLIPALESLHDSLPPATFQTTFPAFDDVMAAMRPRSPAQAAAAASPLPFSALTTMKAHQKPLWMHMVRWIAWQGDVKPFVDDTPVATITLIRKSLIPREKLPPAKWLKNSPCPYGLLPPPGWVDDGDGASSAAGAEPDSPKSTSGFSEAASSVGGAGAGSSSGSASSSSATSAPPSPSSVHVASPAPADRKQQSAGSAAASPRIRDDGGGSTVPELKTLQGMSPAVLAARFGLQVMAHANKDYEELMGWTNDEIQATIADEGPHNFLPYPCNNINLMNALCTKAFTGEQPTFRILGNIMTKARMLVPAVISVRYILGADRLPSKAVYAVMPLADVHIAQ